MRSVESFNCHTFSILPFQVSHWAAAPNKICVSESVGVAGPGQVSTIIMMVRVPPGSRGVCGRSLEQGGKV